MTRVYNWFGGRSTFFAFWFFAVGCVLAFVGKLTGQYVALATGVQTLIVGRAVAEDFKKH